MKLGILLKEYRASISVYKGPIFAVVSNNEKSSWSEHDLPLAVLLKEAAVLRRPQGKNIAKLEFGVTPCTSMVPILVS